MNKIKFYHILITILGLLTIYLYISKKENKIIIPEISQEIIKDSIIRDSIYIVNDSIIVKIKYINKEYNEKTSTIMSSTDSTNLMLFSRYIEDYKRTIKDN